MAKLFKVSGPKGVLWLGIMEIEERQERERLEWKRPIVQAAKEAYLRDGWPLIHK